ncbi:MAG: hypothetical protein KAS02_01910 [Candidatus Pacebacteria bacterium]|nr:hypothetical protein [Candidatus Paceibacterota bacterium]
MTEKKEIKIKSLENSMVEIEASITVKELEKQKEKAIKNLGADIKLDGFRQGHVPQDVLIKQIGELPLLNEMANLALSDIYPTIIIQNDIKAIGQPNITITKIAPGNPVDFKITVAIMPELKLPDYKKIAKDINNEKEELIEITEKEFEDTLTQIQKMNTPQPTPVKDENGVEKAPEPKLPEINDEFVQKLGDFKDVADFKAKLKENIKKEKENKASEAKKIKTIDVILEKIKIDLPQIIIDSELERMLAQTKSDITRMGLQFDKYLEHLKKTEEEFKNELKPEAEKKAMIQIVLDNIIKEEKIVPKEEEVNKNVEELLKQHKEAKEEQVRPYVEMVLSNQEVFKFLEEQK